MTKAIKALSILMIVLMIITTTTPVLASTIGNIGGVNINTGAANQSVKNNVQKLGNNILSIIRVVGTVIAVGVLMVIGIKYMMGSAEEKASYKKTMLPYIIGAVILFAAVNIAGYVVTLSNTFV